MTVHGPTPSRTPAHRGAVALGLCWAVLGAGPAPAQPSGAQAAAVLQGLDKTTARVSTVEVPVGGSARFGSLQIVARACHKKPPTETPESAAFLEIVDIRPDSPAVGIFTGWMFASSPAISALEHPVYDIWVIDCRYTSQIEKTQAPDGVPPGGQKGAAEGDATGEFPEDPEGEAAGDGDAPLPAQ